MIYTYIQNIKKKHTDARHTQNFLYQRSGSAKLTEFYIKESPDQKQRLRSGVAVARQHQGQCCQMGNVEERQTSDLE